jgi:hypothetical protein
MKKDESLLPRTALQSYVTDKTLDDLSRLCIEFTNGNRAEFVRQCLQIGIEEFEKLKKNKVILEKTQDALIVEDFNDNTGYNC